MPPHRPQIDDFSVRFRAAQTLAPAVVAVLGHAATPDRLAEVTMQLFHGLEGGGTGAEIAARMARRFGLRPPAALASCLDAARRHQIAFLAQAELAWRHQKAAA